MRPPKGFMINTHFDWVNKGPVYEFFCKKMVFFVTSFWFSVITLFRFLTRYLFRFQIDDKSQKKIFSSPDVGGDQIASGCDDPMPELEVIDYEDSGYDGVSAAKDTTPEFSFKFQFQSYEDTRRINGNFTANTNKYEFLHEKDFSGFMEEPEVVSLTVKELFLNSNDDNKEILDDGFLSEKDFPEINLEEEYVHEEIMNNLYSGEDSEKPESVVLTEVPLSEKEQSINSDGNSPEKEEFNHDVRFLSEKELVSSDSESESINLWDKFSVMVNTMDSNNEEFLSDEDFDSGAEPETVVELDNSKRESVEAFQKSEEMHLESQRISDDQGRVQLSNPTSPVQSPKGHESTDLDEILEMIGDIEKLEELHLPNSSISETDAQIEIEFCEIQAECEREDPGAERAEILDSFEISEETSLQDESLSDFEESNSLETLWEHQDLIEQLKMELKKVRATGLPTILEESESPRMSDDLKPWKIDEKFVHEDQMNGLHKFYKSYRERMRKFDILNYQKMYAIGFLQLKDPLNSISKSSAPTLASLLSQNFLIPKRRRPETDSSMTFIRELVNDLELVYVGHLCLSWEFLHWQYGKARELLESDPYEIRPYNQVAGEFQQFQVLMQRFLENEPFQGPRVQSYIKNRCVLRNLLQVPVVKEDPKDKEGRKRTKDAITCSMLLEIIEASMQIFWEFVKTDKHDGNAILNGLSRPQVKSLDPADTELLVDVQTNLQKKEKKLKDILRSGNCLVKRFQKHHKEQPDQLLFFSQIDLKLVSRVLKMSRITRDQLVWCHTKLKCITFVQRKVHVEPSFLLFPCY